MYAQVIVDIVHENVDKPYTYRIPEGMDIQVGHRVHVPFGRQEKEGIVLAVSEECTLDPDKVRSVVRPMEPYPAVLPENVRLAQWMAQENHCPLAETLRLMIPSELRRKTVRVRYHKMVALTVSREAALEAAQAEHSRNRAHILRFLCDGVPHSMEELRALVSEPYEALRQLETRQLIRIWQEELLRTPGQALHAGREEEPELTEEQTEVLARLLPAMESGKGHFLLYGVTGSGKTEVFIRLVRACLAQGRTAVILVPEIALTPQMVDWFRARFGSVAAVLHSGLSPGEKYDEWRRIRLGQARVVIGARSAVFAPVENAGLYIVDEEHESTYFSDRHPRYDAREIAIWRAKESGGITVFSSATPSILSFAKARRQVYELLEMPHRVGNRPMPEVQLVDMRKELQSGNRSMFSRPLQSALAACIGSGHQAMLLMNHRGYYSFVSCRNCGTTIKCPNCDVSMTYHLVRGDGKLHCHYCGNVMPVPAACPDCGSNKIRYFGSGTQKVEDELAKMFPGLRAGRMDLDTTAGKDGHARILEDFRLGRTQVLVGTQMIAKGLDFPQVTLVGVLAADMSLHIPDYRAQEKTFQLLTQVAGRAGRGQEPGKVIVQTYEPDNPVLQLAARQDYRAFFVQELERRRIALYPPYTAMARLLVESRDPMIARRGAEGLYARCESLLQAHPEYAECRILMHLEQPVMGFLRGKERWQVLMKLRIRPQLDGFVASVSAMAQEGLEAADVYFEYNPSTMM